MYDFNDKSIILFDGVCNLCNSSINFIIKNDSKERFLFASLQSDATKEILLHLNSENLNINSILLIENGIIYKKSTAVLKISKSLDGLIKASYFFIIIPEFLRDWFYSIIANNRYKWFGKKEKCMVPSLEIKERFLV